MVDDFHKLPRIYINAAFRANEPVTFDKAQCHYIVNVMRLKPGDKLRLFNGCDGEWLSEISKTSRRDASAICQKQLRMQVPLCDLHYLFAPLKHARLDYMVQKATEMGVGVLQPVFTQNTNVSRIKMERMRANAVEAAEQCNLLSIPEVREPKKLEQILSNWDKERKIIFCDEGAEHSSPVNTLNMLSENGSGAFAVLIGPEGGFTQAERTMLHQSDCTIAISLGPRIMRADTAAVAALALVQAVLGDWHN